MTALAYVNHAWANGSTTAAGGGTLSTAAMPLAAGNHVFVYVGVETYNPTITVSDTAGNSYTALAKTFFGTSGYKAGGQWFYCINATGHAANVVTATLSSQFDAGVRAIILSGTAPISVTQSTATATSVGPTLADLVNCGAGAMLLVGSSAGWADEARAFSTFGIADAWTDVSGGTNNKVGIAYLARPNGDYNRDAPIITGYYTGSVATRRVLQLLAIDNGGAAPIVDSRASKLAGYALLGAHDTRATLSKLTGYAVIDIPVPSNLRTAQLVVEVLRDNNARFVNDRDTLLRATTPRYSPSAFAALLLSATAQVFRVNAGGVPSPATTTITAQLIGLSGTVTFTAAFGSILTVTGNTATLAYADLGGSTETVTASLTSEGVLYTASLVIGTVTDGAAGAPGVRGPVQLAFAGYAAWSDAAAEFELDAAGYGAPINRDIVTLYDSGNSTTKFFDAGAWLAMSAYIDGNLLVTNTVSCAKLTADVMTGQEIRTAATGERIEINHQTAGVGDNMLRAYDAAGNMLAEIGAGATGGLVAANSTASGVGAIWGHSSASGAGVVGVNVSANGHGATGTVINSASPAAGVAGATDGTGAAVHGETTGSSTAVVAILGESHTGAEGWVAPANGYDFYAAGSGTNYGPFTGAHDVLLPKAMSFEPGDIVIDVACIERAGWSSTIFEVRRSSAPGEAGAVGIIANIVGNLGQYQPAVFVKSRKGVDAEGKPVRQITMNANYHAVKGLYKLAAANALGEGQVNVTGEGGDIAVGDLLMTSSMPGKAMRQGDNVLRNITVARAREAAAFASPGDVRKIACIYLCG